MQHPSETTHAKNTVSLIKLCMPQVKVYIGENEADFDDLKTQLGSSSRSWFKLYPDTPFTPLESIHQSQKNSQPIGLIILDGTWKKTFKMLKLNPWLNKYPNVSFSQPPSSRYVIRKAAKINSLSTLEALAYSLELIESIDTSPLFKLFTARQNQFLVRK